MTLASTDIQTLIVLEVGETTPASLSGLIPTIWQSYTDKAAIHPRLQELYAKRRAIDIVLGSIRNQVTFSTDGSISLQLSQRTAYLNDRRSETVKEIIKLEKTAQANRTPAIAPLSAVELETPPDTWRPDANDEVYRGSPYFRR